MEKSKTGHVDSTPGPIIPYAHSRAEITDDMETSILCNSRPSVIITQLQLAYPFSSHNPMSLVPTKNESLQCFDSALASNFMKLTINARLSIFMPQPR